jgi:hypothetical protein
MSDSKPISEKRLAANRENAKKSTGPRTEEGKARSSRNAVKHGFRASAFAVVRLEDLDEVEKLKADAVACYKPVNSQELIAVERIAMAQQQIFRGARLDAGMFTSAMNEVIDRTNNPVTPMDPDMVGAGDIEITRQQNRNYCIAEGFRRIAKESNAIGLMLRYRAQAEREYRRAVEDFDRLKALRHEMPNEPNVGLEPEPEDIVPVEELNWELPHIRIEQQKKANRLLPNEPTVAEPLQPVQVPEDGRSPSSQITSAQPNEAISAVPNEPNATPGSAIPRLLTSSTPDSPLATTT